MTIRVVVADDHAVVRSGLEQLLATAADIELVGTAGNGGEAAEVVGRETAGRGAHGPVDARGRRRGGDASHHRGRPRRARGRADVIRR